MAKECGSVDLQPVLRVLAQIQREQSQQRQAIQMLGRLIIQQGKGRGGGSEYEYQEAALGGIAKVGQTVFQIAKNVATIMFILETIQRALGLDVGKAQNNALQQSIEMTRKDVWTVSNKVSAMDSKINQMERKVNDTLYVVNVTRPEIKGAYQKANDAAFAATQASNKLNGLNEIKVAVVALGVALGVVGKGVIGLAAGQATMIGLLTAMGKAIAGIPIAVATIVGKEILALGASINANIRLIPDQVATRIATQFTALTQVVRMEHTATREWVNSRVTVIQSAITKSELAVTDWIKKLPQLADIDRLTQRVIVQLSTVAQQNTRLIIDRIIALPIKEIWNEVKDIRQILITGISGINRMLQDMIKEIGEQLKTIKRIYNLLGGSRWFSGKEDTPQLTFSPWGEIQENGSSQFSNDGKTKDITVYSLPDYLKSFISFEFYRLGLHRFPAKVPLKLHLKEGEEDKELEIGSWLDFSHWQFQQLDSALGMYPIRMKYKDASGTEKKLEIDNVAEGMSEMIGILLSLDSDTDILTEMTFKQIGETVQNKAALSLVNDYLVMISDFLGFKYEIDQKKMPLPIDPKATSIKGFLAKSEQTIQKAILKEPGDNDIISKLNNLLIVAGMTRAALTRRTERNGLVGDEIREEVEKQEDEWDKFIQFVNSPPTSLKNKGEPTAKIKDRTSLIGDE